MRCFYYLLLLTLAFGSFTKLHSQVTVHGRVVDDRTLEPLAFVHVLPVDARQGTTTDIDGRFAIVLPVLPLRLAFSYVGYEALQVVVNDASPGIIRMHRAQFELKEVRILPGENPAHRIIDRVYANRKLNDSMRQRSHRYTSYGKTVFTAAMDSALLNDPARLAALDSSDKEAVDFFDKQHLLLIESATRKSFIPPAAEKEEVLAMRVSGLKDPTLLALAASTKTFSIYSPQISINEKSYLGPIGPNSTDRYLFIVEDTLYQGRDSVYVISYRPRHGRKFDALKGVLWVNTDGYAIQHVIAEPNVRDKGTNIKLQQQFDRVSGVWFPVQLNTFLFFDFIQVNTFKMMGIGRIYLKDIEVDVPIPRKEVRGPELVMDRLAARRDEAFWNGLRVDSLQPKELRTYHTIDSISEVEHIETKLKWFERLTTGRLPLGPFDLRLDRIARYNGYEGLRLGAGFNTNDKLTRYASIGGYYAYGFVDAASKFGGELVVKPKPGIGPELKGFYEYDVVESGGVAFPGVRNSMTSTESYRWLYVDRMDQVERYGAELSWRVGSSTRMWLASERNERRNLIGYQYAEPVAEGVTVLSDRTLLGTVSLGFRFAWREQLVRLPDRQYALPSKWPVLHVQVMNAVKGLYAGERDLWRVDAMIEKSFRLRMLGVLGVRILGGIVEDTSPYTYLYDLRGSNQPRTPIATQNTFETMRPNEFLADRYGSIHLRHSFGKLLYEGKWFRPVPVIVVNAAWGSLSHPERHRGYTFTPLADGFYEGGLQIDNVLRLGFTGLGVGAFYRMGPNSFPDPADNLVVKATIGLVLGK
ncbi:MAG: carboxypeptidase-like regulatory domain-containing protein [Flavobacteriales bacterium]|nr:carboxypeptidase-like regulatory domain-containing protein [Flavobacteriales bacterium]MBL0128521.1 carboxypeptidase-like regulatory domain-containing protein [Flavobacteriales bacterium]MCC6938227.1 carboxypeptidase-like regulatory domain-containing protein [Flavobacteriales bacterium]